MLHAFTRDDQSISVSLSTPTPAAAASSALTLKVKVLSCQESAALWAPNPEYPACVPGDRKLKAKAWAMFLPRGALTSLNLTAGGKGIQVGGRARGGGRTGAAALGCGRPPEGPPPAPPPTRVPQVQVWHNNTVVKPAVPLASPVPASANLCDQYRAAFKKTSLFHSVSALGSVLGPAATAPAALLLPQQHTPALPQPLTHTAACLRLGCRAWSSRTGAGRRRTGASCSSTPGWPGLVSDPCPYGLGPGWGAPHRCGGTLALGALAESRGAAPGAAGGQAAGQVARTAATPLTFPGARMMQQISEVALVYI